MSHYSNFASRLQPNTAKPANSPVRPKVASKRQRQRPVGETGGRNLAALLGLAAAALLGAATAHADPFVMSASPGVFSPSFRDGTNTDLGNTTFFGWGPATGWGTGGNFRFDGSTDDEFIDNPAALQGVGGLTGTLNQVDVDDILASSNNIYTAAFLEEHLTLQIPTNGNIGLGFTTIIIQGRSTNFGPDPVVYPDGTFAFPVIGGDTPDVVTGTNASNQGQFWAKYEIAGNQANYEVDLGLFGGNVSIVELQVDTQWSAGGYASDTAVATPEPTSAALLGTAGMLLLARRRRPTKAMPA